MALYRAETKPISRKDGRSSVAAAAYRSGACLVDDRTGNAHDYTRRRGVVATGIITPDGQGCERNALWNGAEAAEKRKDGRTAREWVLALPAELTDQQRLDLTAQFSRSLAERFGVAVDFAIHRPGREGDQRNHHAHVLTTTRHISRDASGALVFGDKAQP
ncbi:MobA/MobL family protein, partial [Acetobacter cibinongensis]